MSTTVIEALAGSAGGGLLIALVYVAYVSIKNAKNNKANQMEAKNNIQISTGAPKTVDYLINTLQQVNSKLESIQTQLHELEQKQTNYSKAFKIYVDNNGVENSVKNAIKRV
ncbi:hypothetical protein ACX1NA_03410, partial [Mycoplasma sp. VS276A1]